MSLVYFKRICMLIAIISVNVNCQGSYGQTGNSQVGANTSSTTLTTPTPTTNTSPVSPTATNTSPTTPTTTGTTPDVLGYTSSCIESDPASICITKPTCCHVTNQYGAYIYSACVDARSSNNFFNFCRNFYDLNAKENFYAAGCICYGNYLFNGSSYISFGYTALLMILMSILF
jgi:hypothetical protein